MFSKIEPGILNSNGSMKKMFRFLAMLTVLTSAFGALPLKAQDYYWVRFTDKAQTPFSIEEPEAFLSERAIERRRRHGVEITEEDLPVSLAYLDSLRAIGVPTWHTSRWLNAATVLTDAGQLPAIQAFPFVDTVFFVGRYHTKLENKRDGRPYDDSLRTAILEEMPYGYGDRALRMLKGDFLHGQNYRGQDRLIAVLDGGFTQVDVIPFFDSIRLRKQLVAHYDFVDQDENVFESAAHGTKVLSTMAANVPGLLVGTAPSAQYVLIKTEDVRSEFPAEECHWIAGLEYADSLGADIATTSLGYSTFTDEAMNYQYDDLDGSRALASMAAEKAYARGMLLLVSAGNEGYSSWKHITVPADSKHVLAVGATDFKGRKASFSSIGPAADGRIKPDVSGPGVRIPVSSVHDYRVGSSSGTSISTPIIAGLTACLWQAFPEKTNAEIIEAIRQSGSQAETPDNKMGYGIPDFQKAFEILSNRMLKGEAEK